MVRPSDLWFQTHGRIVAMFWKTSPTRSRFVLVAASLALSIAISSSSTGIVSAQEGAAPMGPLNPANWKMPSFKMPSFQGLMPGNDEKARIKKKKDGLFQEVTKTATNSWTKTKEVFNPAKLNPTNFFTASSRTPAKEKSPGFFSSLFSPAPQPRQTGSVTDFLSQDRPNP